MTIHSSMTCVADDGPPEPSPASRSTSDTILLVDDAESIREVNRTLLEDDGYTVLEAANGADALRIARDHPGPIQLLMTDLTMPHMNGRALAKEFARLRPDAKTLYVSGDINGAPIRFDGREPPVAFLGKPYRYDALCRQVQALLGSGAAAGDDGEPLPVLQDARVAEPVLDLLALRPHPMPVVRSAALGIDVADEPAVVVVEVADGGAAKGR